MQQSEITCTYIVSEERIDCEDKLYLDIFILYTPGIYVSQKNDWSFNWNAYSMYKSWMQYEHNMLSFFEVEREFPPKIIQSNHFSVLG